MKKKKELRAEYFFFNLGHEYWAIDIKEGIHRKLNTNGLASLSVFTKSKPSDVDEIVLRNSKMKIG